MANEVLNYVVVRHSDPALIEELSNSVSSADKGLFAKYLPLPDSVTDDGHVSFFEAYDLDKMQVEMNRALTSQETESLIQKYLEKYGLPPRRQWFQDNWGCTTDAMEIASDKVSDNEVRIEFSTNWTPPLRFYQFLIDKLGYQVVAYYYDYFSPLAGKWESGIDWQCTWESLEDAKKVIPADLDEIFHVVEELEKEKEKVAAEAAEAEKEDPAVLEQQRSAFLKHFEEIKNEAEEYMLKVARERLDRKAALERKGE